MGGLLEHPTTRPTTVDPRLGLARLRKAKRRQGSKERRLGTRDGWSNQRNGVKSGEK